MSFSNPEMKTDTKNALKKPAALTLSCEKICGFPNQRQLCWEH